MKVYKIEKPNQLVLKVGNLNIKKEDILKITVYEGEYASSTFFNITTFSIVNNNYIKFDSPLPLNSTVVIILQNEIESDVQSEIFLLKKQISLLEEAIKNRISHDEIKKYLSMMK